MNILFTIRKREKTWPDYFLVMLPLCIQVLAETVLDLRAGGLGVRGRVRIRFPESKANVGAGNSA